MSKPGQCEEEETSDNILLLLLLLLLLTYLLLLSCHLMAAVLTLVQRKQLGINIPKRSNTKSSVQTIRNTVNTSTRISKTPTHTKNVPK